MSRWVDTFRAANGSLWGAKMRTALTILSILVGAFTLTLGLGVGAGLNGYIKDQVGNVAADAPLSVSKEGLAGGSAVSGLGVEEYDPKKDTTGTATLDADDLDAVRAVPGVERVEPFVNVSVEFLAFGDTKVTARAVELAPTDDPALQAGQVGPAREPGGALLGHAYLKALGVGADEIVGQTVNLVVLDQLRNARQFPVTVAGVTEPSLLGNASVQVPRESMLEMQSYQAAGVDEVLAQVIGASAYLKPGTDPAAVQAAVKDLELVAETAQDQARATSATLRPIQLAVLGFSLVAIIASVFGIVNTLLMSVHERTREIGLLKALGSKDRHIFGQFVAEALTLGLWGSVIGMVLALGAGGLVSNIVADRSADTFPGLDIFAASPGTLLGAPLLIGAIAVLAGVLPARRAMKLDPITALRYE